MQQKSMHIHHDIKRNLHKRKTDIWKTETERQKQKERQNKKGRARKTDTERQKNKSKNNKHRPKKNKQLTNDVWIPLVKDFTFLFNVPYEKVKAHIASLNPKWYVYGLGCLYQDLVSVVDFETLPEEVVQLILSCKEVSPTSRPSLVDVYSALTF